MECIAVIGAHEQLLAPVAEQVSAQAGDCLCTVVGETARCIENLFRLICCGHLLNICVIQNLAFEIAVPVDQEVHRGSDAGNFLSRSVKHIAGMCAPEFRAVVA